MLDNNLTFGGVFFMAKYSYEEKLEAVLRVIEDGMSAEQSGHILGTSKAPVARWVARYKQFGPEGLLLKHGSHDGAFKVSVIEYMHTNHLLYIFTLMPGLDVCMIGLRKNTMSLQKNMRL